MQRYLIHISYMGTHFKSFAKNVINGVPVQPTVLGVIEDTLTALKPTNPLKLVSISRTDTGVHALNNALVVDLERSKGKYYFAPSYVLQCMDKILAKSNHDLRINRVQLVPRDFNTYGKVVLSRSYIYRIAIVKDGRVKPRLEELNRCYFLHAADFNIDRMREAADMLVGRHDFRSFMNENGEAQKKASFALRSIDSIKITPSHPHLLQPVHTHSSDIDYWDITFVGRSYVHRQIRRMVGTFIAYASGKLTKRELYEMLTIPSKLHFPVLGLHAAPGHGLYLANIEFSSTAMQMHATSEQTHVEHRTEASAA